MRWRLLLSECDFDIVYSRGKMNAAPDGLSRVYCAGFHRTTLCEVHDALCHPGVTRLYHFVRSKNLPYSMNDVRKLVESCRVCSAVKPQFYRPPLAQLVKATQPFERLRIDFKGPLPSNSPQRYLLTVVDEYSRFPFAFPCSNVNAQSVIACLTQLFVLFGMPAYIHSDRGSAFLSQELITFLHERDVACSRTSAYNAPGNAQCERYNGIIWFAIEVALKSRN